MVNPKKSSDNDWCRKDKKALGLIVLNIEMSQYGYLKRATTSSEASMESREVLPTLEELKVKLMSEETRRRESLGVTEDDDQEIAFVAQNSKKYKKKQRTRKESVIPPAKQDILPGIAEAEHPTQKAQDTQHYWRPP
ncbi:hypothetical protein RUM43_006645 [Polyplax serrata]|uniref:Uncharacterized protein n=1 Tax=Polyplax serrata TaxID=468196 RepID=A0AAN8S937_POLSC